MVLGDDGGVVEGSGGGVECDCGVYENNRCAVVVESPHILLLALLRWWSVFVVFVLVDAVETLVGVVIVVNLRPSSHAQPLV